MKRNFDIFEGFVPYILYKVDVNKQMQYKLFRSGKEYPVFDETSCKAYGCDFYQHTDYGKFCNNSQWACAGGIFKRISKIKCLYWWFTNNKNLNNVRLFK